MHEWNERLRACEAITRAVIKNKNKKKTDLAQNSVPLAPCAVAYSTRAMLKCKLPWLRAIVHTTCTAAARRACQFWISQSHLEHTTDSKKPPVTFQTQDPI